MWLRHRNERTTNFLAKVGACLAHYGRNGHTEEQLFVFRALEISNVMQRGASKPLPFDAQYFLHFGG